MSAEPQYAATCADHWSSDLPYYSKYSNVTSYLEGLRFAAIWLLESQVHTHFYYGPELLLRGHVCSLQILRPDWLVRKPIVILYNNVSIPAQKISRTPLPP